MNEELEAIRTRVRQADSYYELAHISPSTLAKDRATLLELVDRLTAELQAMGAAIDAEPDETWTALSAVEAERDALRAALAETAGALRLADVYLDGFVWLSEPEFSELESIKEASKRARAVLAKVTE